MNLQTEIAVAVLHELEHAGYLRKALHHDDATLLPKVAETIRAKLHDERLKTGGFIIWWAEIGHRQHAPDPKVNPFAPRGFRHCEHPMCLSLLGTLTGLELEIGQPCPTPSTGI